MLSLWAKRFAKNYILEKKVWKQSFFIKWVYLRRSKYHMPVIVFVNCAMNSLLKYLKKTKLIKWCLPLLEHLWRIALLMNAMLLNSYICKMLFQKRYFKRLILQFHFSKLIDSHRLPLSKKNFLKVAYNKRQNNFNMASFQNLYDRIWTNYCCFHWLVKTKYCL